MEIVYHRPGLNSKAFRSIYVEKAYSTVDSDSSVGWGLSLAAPLVLFEKSRLWSGTGFHILPSFHHHHHHHHTQHNYTTQTVTHTVTLNSTSSSTLYRHSSHTNVVCPSGAWIENRPYSTPSIRLAWYPKHVIVQWVDIGIHRQTEKLHYINTRVRR